MEQKESIVIKPLYTELSQKREVVKPILLMQKVIVSGRNLQSDLGQCKPLALVLCMQCWHKSIVPGPQASTTSTRLMLSAAKLAKANSAVLLRQPSLGRRDGASQCGVDGLGGVPTQGVGGSESHQIFHPQAVGPWFKLHTVWLGQLEPTLG